MINKISLNKNGTACSINIIFAIFNRLTVSCGAPLPTFFLFGGHVDCTEFNKPLKNDCFDWSKALIVLQSLFVNRNVFFIKILCLFNTRNTLSFIFFFLLIDCKKLRHSNQLSDNCKIYIRLCWSWELTIKWIDDRNNMIYIYLQTFTNSEKRS